MAMSAGSITVNGDGTHSGTGMSVEIMDAWLAKPLLSAALTGVTGAALSAAKGNLAELCEAIAEAAIAHMVAHAVPTVLVRVTDSGLQQTPNPNNPDTDTQAPSAQKSLTGSLA